MLTSQISGGKCIDSFSIKNTHGAYDCALEVLARLYINLLIMAAFGKFGGGRYKGRSAGLYIFFQ